MDAKTEKLYYKSNKAIAKGLQNPKNIASIHERAAQLQAKKSTIEYKAKRIYEKTLKQINKVGINENPELKSIGTDFINRVSASTLMDYKNTRSNMQSAYDQFLRDNRKERCDT